MSEVKPTSFRETANVFDAYNALVDGTSTPMAKRPAKSSKGQTALERGGGTNGQNKPYILVL